jgi:Zn-dependent metalloprotease
MKMSKLSSKRGMIFNILAIFIFASTLAVGSDFSVAAKSSPAEAAVADLQSQCFGTAKTDSNALTGKVNFIGASPDKPISQPMQGLRAASPEAAARGYLSECGSFLGLSDQKAELSVIREKKADGGRSVVRFQQMYQNIPVFAAEMLVQLNTSNDVVMVNSAILPAENVQVDTQAEVDAAVAQQAALQLVADKYQVKSETLKVSDAQLWIYNPIQLGAEGGDASLVWRMEVTPVGIAPIRELVMLDAHSGGTILNFNQVDNARNRLTYTLSGATSGSGTLVCNEADPNCTAGGSDTDAVNAHVYAGDTYDYYFNNLGRNSIDNAGMTLYSYVHYDVGYCNAFWDGYEMVYGDGCFIVADDVVAHELTHGVTQYESNLVYSNQSGAINESLSDIFGEFMDLTNSKGNDGASVRWLMGEDTSLGAIRDMKTPANYSQPDKMSSPYYYTGTSDNGGVHTNSGVGNKAAYLIADGAIFNGYTVTGLGIPKAAHIFYEAQTNILLSNSNYYSLYLALNQACTNLVGLYGITTSDCTQVNNATLATEMGTVSVVPTILAPIGTITTTKPTYKWSQVTGAVQYRYQMVKGTKTIYIKTVGSSACAGGVCKNTPTTVLADGAYKWRVQAKIGSVWKAYSAYKSFTVNTKPKAGRWYNTAGWMQFYVIPNQRYVKYFAIAVSLSCGNYTIYRPAPVAISSKKFSFSGSFFANGTFSSPTKASGRTGLNHFGPICGYYWNAGPWNWASPWRDSSQPLMPVGLGQQEESMFTLSTLFPGHMNAIKATIAP